MKRGDEAVGLIVSLQCGFQRDWVANKLTERVGMEARRIESDPGAPVTTDAADASPPPKE
jgi:hypothetical protein